MSELKYKPIREEKRELIINAEVRNLIEKIAPLYADKREAEKVIQMED